MLLEVAGAVLLVVAAAMLSPTLAVAAAGLLAVLFGVAVERG